MDAEFAPHMLYVTNQDKPGFIGRLGTLLGDAGVNIATFNLGRDAAGGDAIALVVDRPDDDLAEAARWPQVHEMPHVSPVWRSRF